jgi:Na+-translocating ferredoxin:NAD+ oxidoreductase RnfD subunit
MISMRILNQTVASVYLWSIALLILLAGVSSYTLNQLPLSLILAVTVCALVEIIITKSYLKRGFKIPFSGIITGLIIGCVAPYNASFLVITTAALVAILSKFFIKARGSNVFNPAALGLLVSLASFSIGDQWWAASNYSVYGLTISLTPLLIIATYKARRLVLSLSFVSALIIISALRNPSNLSSLSSLDTMFFTINFFYPFMMLPEPKTSPNKNTAQAAYGISTATLYSVLAIYKTAYPLFTALLLGNIIYALYRTRGRKPNKQPKT